MKFISIFLIVFSLCSDIIYGTSSFYTDNHLGQSVPIQKIEKRQQKEIQQEILELMGLYSKPKPKSNKKILQSASKFMRELYESLNVGDDETQGGADNSHNHINRMINASAMGLDPTKVDGSDVIVSFVNHAQKISHLRHQRDRTFFFDFSEVSVGDELRGAELRLYKEVPIDVQSGGTYHISLYKIKPGQDWEDKVLEFESSMAVQWDTHGWLTLDATKAAEGWTFFPHSNMGLYMKITDAYGKEYKSEDFGIVGRKGPADKQPFLVGYMDMSPEVLARRTRSIRKKRATSNPSDVTYNDNPYAQYSRSGRARYSNAKDCQRHNLYINFRDIGYTDEFLIAPDGYHAFYCAGQCSFPLGIHMNATNHAIVQTLVHVMTPQHIPKPCCAPTQFSTINLLYYDDKSSIVLKRFREMIVKACGCH